MGHIESFNILLNTTKDERYQRWNDFRSKVDSSLLNVIGLLDRKDVAVVVGAGRCEDFSLKQLINSFTKVVLADIDLDAVITSDSYKSLSKEELGKLELIKVEFTGVENSGLFNDFENRIRVCDDFDAIEEIINKGFAGVDKYKFLKSYYYKADLVYVSPIYTQLVYQQIMLTVAKLRTEGFSENLLKYIENLVADKLVEVFRMFNNNLRRITKGYLVVASDIFQDYSNSNFMINIKKDFTNKHLDEVYEQYHTDYGFGMGDLGLFLLNESIDLMSYEWLLWPFDSKNDMVVKLSIYKNK